MQKLRAAAAPGAAAGHQRGPQLLQAFGGSCVRCTLWPSARAARRARPCQRCPLIPRNQGRVCPRRRSCNTLANSGRGGLQDEVLRKPRVRWRRCAPAATGHRLPLTQSRGRRLTVTAASGCWKLHCSGSRSSSSRDVPPAGTLSTAGRGLPGRPLVELAAALQACPPAPLTGGQKGCNGGAGCRRCACGRGAARERRERLQGVGSRGDQRE